MKWFTRQLHQGEMPDAAWGTAIEQYEAHLAKLLPKFPPGLHNLAMMSLHDARFKGVAINITDAIVIIGLVGGDLQQGYFRLIVRYEQAMLVGVSPGELLALVSNPQTEVLYDELDLDSERRYEHRFLLWPHGEFGVCFSDADISILPASSEEYQDEKRHGEIIP